MAPSIAQYRSLSLSRLGKIRCRVLDKECGEPIGGVVVHLALRLGDADSRARLPVSALCSDATGYLSFDLQRLIEAGVDTAGALLVSAPQLGIKDRDLLGELVRAAAGEDGSDTSGSDPTASPVAGSLLLRSRDEIVSDGGSLDLVFPIWAEKKWAERVGCATPGLPAVQAPDAVDYELSPYSFVMPTPTLLDSDCCEQLVPSTLPVQEHSFYKVVIHHKRGRADGDGLAAAVESVDVTERLRTKERTRVKFAHVLEYRQSWFSIGHALGEIKYSLPLAPGESTELAVIEWSRDDTASRFDQVRGTEFLEHDLRRDRGITDAIDAGLSERQGGSSFLAGASSGMVYDTVVYGKYTGNWGLGGGSSNSWGDRDVIGDFQNDLHDHVAQGTAFVRSQRSAVILQATQTEKNALQTRRVANHNHCHALTIQYYEVLRHYRLETLYVGRRNAILIPFKPITTFTSALALQFQTLLERALLDDRLTSCFDALVRLAIGPGAYTDEPTEARPGADEGEGSEEERGEDEFFTGAPLIVDSAAPPKSTGLMIEKGSTLTISTKIGPEGEIKFGGGQFRGSGLDGLGGATDDRWPAKELRSGALCARIAGDKWVVGYGTTHVAKEEGELVFFFNDYSPDDNKGTAEVTRVSVSKPQPEPKSSVSRPDEQLGETGPFSQRADRICEERLLSHLNANLGHYNGAIWMLMDPAQRRMYLEETLGEDSELLYGIDDIPLTVTGNRVVFPFSGPIPETSSFEEAKPKPRRSIVTLPTRGLFAEAQLGHCNACELRDITRMWDWTEMTVEEPPEIGGITPGPRGQMPQLTPAPLPANVIQIAQPPEAPAPTGVSAALSLLGAANLFRDMSGLDEASALLGKLADGTISSLEGVKTTAKEAKEKVDKAREGDSTKNGTGDSSKQRQTPKERFDNMQVLKQLADDKGTFGLTDEEISDLAKQWLGEGSQQSDWASLYQQAQLQTKAANAALPDPDPHIADAAEAWGDSAPAMDAYVKFDGKTWAWFFSPNPKLAGSISRPASFTDWSDWATFRWQARKVMTDLAGLNDDQVVENDTVLTRLKEAFDYWAPYWFAIFQGGGTRTAACNLFVGDALATRGIDTTSAGGKYWTAAEIVDGKGPFWQVPAAEATRGDIVCFGKFHIEIVTSVRNDRKAFCSRGVIRPPAGGEKCGNPDDPADSRAFGSSVRFFRPSG